MKHLTASVFAFAVAVPALAGAPDSVPPRTLTVSGTGIAKAAPDEASFSTGVVSQGATAGAALTANTKAMNAVIATLKRQGVPEKAIQTSNLSLNPQYQVCKPNMACPQKIVGYEVTNTVTVTIGIDKAGTALDALVVSGANRVDGISFAIHDDKPLLAQARADAVKEAIAKAEVYVKAAGVTLGPIQSIDEGGSVVPRPMYKMRAMANLAEAAVPLAGGEQSVSATVSITWEIK
jgi:uncharacterized protein YggE